MASDGTLIVTGGHVAQTIVKDTFEDAVNLCQRRQHAHLHHFRRRLVTPSLHTACPQAPTRSVELYDSSRGRWIMPCHSAGASLCTPCASMPQCLRRCFIIIIMITCSA